MIARNLLAQTSTVVSRAFSTKLAKEIKALQEMCKKFSNEELKPVADRVDKDCKYPRKQIKKLGELGLMGISVATEYGGSNLNSLALSVVVEELSQGCGSTGAIVSIHNCLYASLLNRLGSDEQKAQFLKPYVDGSRIGAFALSESDAGSDVAALSTTATRDGDFYILNGCKAWVTSGLEADGAIIFATTDKNLKHKGITAFIVDMTSSGVQRGSNDKKIGLRGSSTCSIYLNEVRVPSANILGNENGGFKIAMHQLDLARIGIAALGLGIAQASLDLAVKYAAERIAFNKPILEMTTVQTRLAEMALRIEASRLLIRQAASMSDENISTTKFTSMAKLHASETATFCSHQAIQILGGMGVVEEMPAERFYRDARITEIFGGITDVQKLIIAGQLRREYGL